MFCSRCGRKADSEDAFCGLCGSAIPWSSIRLATTSRARHHEGRFFKYALIAVPTFAVFLLIIILYLANPGDEHHATAQSTTTTAVEPANPESPAPPRTEPAPESSSISESPKIETPIPDRPQPARLTELRGSLARRREYDLWLIRYLSYVIDAPFVRWRIEIYCMTTVDGARQSLDSAPEYEYALEADGTVLKTSEQRYRDVLRSRMELGTGSGPLVQDCIGSFEHFGTWHDQPMPNNEKLAEIVAKTMADLEEIDKTLDPQLVEVLPKPKAQ